MCSLERFGSISGKGWMGLVPDTGASPGVSGEIGDDGPNAGGEQSSISRRGQGEAGCSVLAERERALACRRSLLTRVGRCNGRGFVMAGVSHGTSESPAKTGRHIGDSEDRGRPTRSTTLSRNASSLYPGRITRSASMAARGCKPPRWSGRSRSRR